MANHDWDAAAARKERLAQRFSMSVVFDRKFLADSMLRNRDNCPRAKKPGENGGDGR